MKNTEQKTIGQLSVRQFLIVLVGAMLIFLLYRFATFYVFVVGLWCVLIPTLLFAFVKVNGKTFYQYLRTRGTYGPPSKN